MSSTFESAKRFFTSVRSFLLSETSTPCACVVLNSTPWKPVASKFLISVGTSQSLARLYVTLPSFILAAGLSEFSAALAVGVGRNGSAIKLPRRWRRESFMRGRVSEAALKTNQLRYREIRGMEYKRAIRG